MKMGRVARRTRRGVAGIVATIIMFAILFTVGTSYFIFVNASNAQYLQNLVTASNKMQGSLGESLQITTLLASNGDLAFYVNNTSGLSINMTEVYVLAPNGGLLKCDGVGLPPSAGCGNTSPTLWAVVNAGKGSPGSGKGVYDTGYLYLTGVTDTVKVLTQRGNTYSATYPNNAVNQASQASSAQALTINLATYRWLQLVPQSTSLSHSAYSSNCNSANCALSFGSSTVTAGDYIVDAVGWYNHAPPSGVPTDTLGDTFHLGASNSVSSNVLNPVMVQTGYTSSCNASACAKAFSSNVAAGDILVYGLGWYTNPAPSTPTDTLGDTYSLAVSKSAVWSGSPALVQSAFGSCGASSCAKQFTSAVTVNNVMAVALGWNNHGAPTSVTDTLGNTYTLQASAVIASTPAVSQTVNEVYCNNTLSCQTGKLGGVPAGDVVVAAVGWATSAAPTVTDSQGDTFTLGASNSVTVSSVTYYSYIYYATAATTNDEKLTATFGVNTNIAITGYDLAQVATSGLQSSTGSSSSGVTSGSVASFTPTANSVVIAEVQNSAAANYNSPSAPYSIPGGTGPCNGAAGTSCSYGGVISSGSTTASDTWANSVGYTEAALSFPPISGWVNTYIYTATAGSSGTDTITASFSSAITNGGISVYEISGATASGAQTSTGTQSGGPNNNAAVTSFTPASNSFVIGNTDLSPSESAGFNHGAGFTQITSGGTCNPTLTCSEYASGVGSATTVPQTVGGGVNVWAEAAISLPPGSITFYSYIWYATAASSGADTITASFSTNVIGSISIYEISGATTSGMLTSQGSSTSASATSSVAAFTVPSNSLIIANVETQGGETITAGSGYTLSGTCNNVFGCGQYQTGVSGSHQSTMNLNPSSPYAEVAVDFAPATWTFYSYIWYALASTSGTDTVTATFSSAVQGTVSLYDITGYSAANVVASTGSSSTATTAVSVTSFTPSSGSMVIGNVETYYTAPNYAAGSGFSLISGSCNPSSYGCSEDNPSVTGATTVPMTLANADPWVESALSFSVPINPQSGYQVGGYPSMGVFDSTTIVWQVSFTNTDAGHRSVTLWPQSVMGINSVKNANVKVEYFFIVDSVSSQVTQINAYTSTNGNFLTIPYGSSVTLYFGASSPLSSSPLVIDYDNGSPFASFFSLTGQFGDGTLYGETIPYPMGIVTQANAATSPTAGATGNSISVTCQGNCGFNNNAKAVIGWIDSTGKLTTLKTFTTTNTGGLPSNLSFTVPSASAGYYTIMVSDYVNTVFMTFQHT